MKVILVTGFSYLGESKDIQMVIDMPIPPQVKMKIITPSVNNSDGDIWMVEDIVYDVKPMLITAWLGREDLDEEEKEFPGFMDKGETLSDYLADYYKNGWEDLPEWASSF